MITSDVERGVIVLYLKCRASGPHCDRDSLDNRHYLLWRSCPIVVYINTQTNDFSCYYSLSYMLEETANTKFLGKLPQNMDKHLDHEDLLAGDRHVVGELAGMQGRQKVNHWTIYLSPVSY